ICAKTTPRFSNVFGVAGFDFPISYVVLNVAITFKEVRCLPVPQDCCVNVSFPQSVELISDFELLRCLLLVNVILDHLVTFEEISKAVVPHHRGINVSIPKPFPVSRNIPRVVSISLVPGHIVTNVLTALEEVGFAVFPGKGGIYFVFPNAEPVSSDGFGVTGIGPVERNVVPNVLTGVVEEVGLAIGPSDDVGERLRERETLGW